MKLREYAQYDGLGLADLISSKEVSHKEVATAAVNAIEALNPTVNAVLEVFRDKLETLDNSSCNKLEINTDAPFAGVPMLLKDIGATEAGRKQEMGSPLMQGHVAAKTSYLTQKFQNAGLVNLGRSALPEFGMGSCNSVSKLHGSTVNPWDPDYMAGSSSGGAGAAVASGMVPIAHASDIGGSTRHPAAICGAVGLKTTRGRTTLGPDKSDFPLGTLNEFAITRSVRDSAALLDAIEGPGFGEPRIVQRPERSYLSETHAGVDLGSIRTAVCLNSFGKLAVDPEIVNSVSQVANALSDMGCELHNDKPVFDYYAMVEADVLAAGSLFGTAFEHMAQSTGIDLDLNKTSPVTQALINHARQSSAIDLFGALEQYNETRRSIHSFFESYDLLVLPVISCQTEKAEIHALENSDMANQLWEHHSQFLLPFNVSGNPAISLPLGTSTSGMPIGVQLVAKHGDEATLFRVASALEKAMPWCDRIPPHHAIYCD